eukprot:663992-Amphidinium_carterae.1
MFGHHVAQRVVHKHGADSLGRPSKRGNKAKDHFAHTGMNLILDWRPPPQLNEVAFCSDLNWLLLTRWNQQVWGDCAASVAS